MAWRVLEREAAWLPPWRELLRVYHRLEARGEIRGGRFVAGLSGEQFALPDAIGALRAVRKRPHDGLLLNLSASDPLNLAGTVLPGIKVPRLPGARVMFRDGVPLATLVAGEVQMLVKLPADDEHAVRSAVVHDRPRWEPVAVATLPPDGDHDARTDPVAVAENAAPAGVAGRLSRLDRP